mgnify:FL=1
MKKLTILLGLIFLAFGLTSCKKIEKVPSDKDMRMEWWRDAKFGMFIHWGLYAIPAGEWKGKKVEKGKIGEWIMHSLDIDISEYEKLANEFNPIKFDASKWVKIAKDAGMKYIVITSKHHDGFSLWDSKVSDYDVIDASPYKRDILMELTNAANEAGIKMCFYYSIMDWHHPDAESPKDYKHQNNPDANWDNYRENYMIPQITELVKKYKPAVLWFDGEWIPEWTEKQGKDLYKYLMELDPKLIINNRISKAREGMSGMNKYDDAAGDFGTPEQEILEETSDYDWESCMTMNDTWGYRKDDDNWKSSEQLIYNLIDVTAKGGNYLLNVGPMANGEIPKESIARLKDIGNWVKINGEAIYSSSRLKPFKQDNIFFTLSKDEKFIYAILTEEISDGKIKINGFLPFEDSEITHLGTNKKVNWEKLSETKFSINFPQIEDFGFGQTLKIRVK